MNQSTQSQHTPRPWRFLRVLRREKSASGVLNITDQAGFPILAITDRNEQDEANARLIAAAPDLLALLEDGGKMLGTLTGENLAVYARTFSALSKQAISKAKGVSHV